MNSPLPTCAAHPRGKVISMRVNPLGERVWFCLACDVELGPAPPGETTWTKALNTDDVITLVD